MNLEYSGFFFGDYPRNRPLSEEEADLHLEQKQKLDYTPWPAWSIIKINSTYLELADKYYDSRGFATPFLLFGVAVGLFMATYPTYSSIEKVLHGTANPFAHPMGAFLSIFTLVLGGGLIWFIWKFLLRRDMFSYTHFPIRLNRRSRMVYVTRVDGTVLSVPWDEVYFTIGRNGKSRTGVNQYWEIRGCVLSNDKKTVLEMFPLTVVDNSTSQELLNHWEFVRRYMEEGPAKLVGDVAYCWPLDKGRESFLTGLKIFCLQSLLCFYRNEKEAWSILQITFLPLSIPFFLVNLAFVPFRWISMRTSKLPRWPAEIDSACQIESLDPYVKDSSINSTFPPSSQIFLCDFLDSVEKKQRTGNKSASERSEKKSKKRASRKAGNTIMSRPNKWQK